MQILTNRWFLALMVVPLLLIKFFWVELRERAGEAPHGTSVLQGGEGWLTQRELGTVTGYKLVPARNNADQVHALKVHVVAREGTQRTLAFTLASNAVGSDYPSLRVTLSPRDGSSERIVEFGPGDYGHGKELSSERIELTLDVRDGETRAVIQPYYGAGGA